MLEKMENAGAKPEMLLVDSGYGSDENVVASAQKNIKLIAPSTGKNSSKANLEECELDSEQRIIKCPPGRYPLFKKMMEKKDVRFLRRTVAATRTPVALENRAVSRRLPDALRGESIVREAEAVHAAEAAWRKG